MVTVFVAVLTHPPVVTVYEISAVPAVTPVSSPDAASIVATAGVSLVHVPPDVVLVHVSEEPIQTGVAPVIVCATGAEIVTVFVAVLTHPPVVTE